MSIARTLGIAAAMLAAPAHAQGLTEQAFRTISEEVFRPVIEEYDIPGIAIGVTLDGERFFFTDGMADRKAARPVDRDTLFELGSNSKLFNVALAALAEQRGLLSLGAPVSSEFPDLTGSAFDAMTLSDLAAHATGGLPLQVPDDVTDTDRLMAYLRNWKPEGDSGSLRAYSNVSIGLLGLVGGDQFGTTYQNALMQELLPALGLDSTFIDVPTDRMAHYAFGYSRTDDSPIRVNPGMLDAEAYGIKSTVVDMTRFLDAHLGNVALEDEMTAALARTRLSEYETAHFTQAMIWEGYPWPVDASDLAAGNASEMALSQQPMTKVQTRQLDGSVFLNKTGSTNGFGSYLAMVPSENIGVVVLANRNYPNAARAEASVELIERLLAEAEG
ncbi:class C beta-lactamase [Paracoccus indicus]|uniref:class C beta-lactamase n=1 Tax=Paracoccus indicus TaxID=2079229 RepID=UPI0014797FDA|nr:class C beta-lactamase [Paracoccus indicus]